MKINITVEKVKSLIENAPLKITPEYISAVFDSPTAPKGIYFSAVSKVYDTYQKLGKWGPATCKSWVQDDFHDNLKHVLEASHGAIAVGVGCEQYATNLRNGYTLKLIRAVEEYLGLKGESSISQTVYPGTFIFHVPKVWLMASPLISMYTLLIRGGIKYDGTGDAMNYIMECSILGSDKAYWEAMIQKIKLFKIHGVHPYTLMQYRHGRSIHDYGIYELSSSTIKIGAGIPQTAEKAVLPL